MIIESYKIAAGVQFNNPVLYDIDGLVRLFHGVSGNNKKNFKSFCRGEFVWIYPNANLTRFTYCPVTGEKINWDEVLKEGLEMFND